MKEKIKVCVIHNELAKRLFFSQRGLYHSMPNLLWLCGVTIFPKIWKHITDLDILIFQESIDNYRKQGIDITVEKVLQHELQHVAIDRKGTQQVEPLMSFAHEYGIIEGMNTAMKFHLVQPHWMLPNVPWQNFYSNANIEDYEIEWYEVTQDSVCIQKLPLTGMEVIGQKNR